jgi:hypothetical protein
MVKFVGDAGLELELKGQFKFHQLPRTIIQL